MQLTNEQVGQKIRHFRKSHHIKQAEMASTIGIGQATLSDWERGEKTPNLISMLRLSLEYGISLEDLFELPLSGKKMIQA